MPAGKFIHRDQADIVADSGNKIATLLSDAETDGRFAVREIVADPGAAPAPSRANGISRPAGNSEPCATASRYSFRRAKPITRVSSARSPASCSKSRRPWRSRDAEAQSRGGGGAFAQAGGGPSRARGAGRKAAPHAGRDRRRPDRLWPVALVPARTVRRFGTRLGRAVRIFDRVGAG